MPYYISDPQIPVGGFSPTIIALCFDHISLQTSMPLGEEWDHEQRYDDSTSTFPWREPSAALYTRKHHVAFEPLAQTNLLAWLYKVE